MLNCGITFLADNGTDRSFKCALRTFKQKLVLKVPARCGISIVLLLTYTKKKVFSC